MTLSRHSGPAQKRTNFLTLLVFSTLTAVVLKGWEQIVKGMTADASSLQTSPPLSQAPNVPSPGLVLPPFQFFSVGETLSLLLFIGLMMALGYQLTLGRAKAQGLSGGYRAGQLPKLQPRRNPSQQTKRASRKSPIALRLERLNLAVEQRPQDPNLWLERGSLLDSLGKYRDAVANYSEALGFHPEHPYLWFSHGLAHAKTGDFNRALKSYDEAVQRRPNVSEFWHAHGDALLELERYPEALDSLKKVQRYSPNFGHIWSDRGLALYKLARYDEAAEELRQAVKRDPQDARSWFHRGEALLVMNRLEEACQNSRKALRIHPEHEALIRQDQHIKARLGIL